MKLDIRTILVKLIVGIDSSYMVFSMISSNVFMILRNFSLLVLSLLITLPCLSRNYLFDMCTSQKFVTNKYTRSRFLCSCGKCEACQQQKAAARSSRIRNEYDGVTPWYFITLTYDRLSVPFIYRSDLEKLLGRPLSEISVYRRTKLKWNPNKQKHIKCFELTKLDSVVIDTHNLDRLDLRARDLNKDPGRIGVCYFKDVQDFEKRLRIYLKRHGYEKKIKYYNCTEYGETTERPHAHILLAAPESTLEQIHSAVIACWKYGDRIRDPKSCQLVSEDPAGYVSSYINCASNLSPFPAVYFKAKHSSSKYFGHGRRAFQLEKIQEAVSKGSLTYDSERIVNGIRQVVNLPVPKYVVNRYFPLFKGYSRLACSEVYEFLSRGIDLQYLYVRSKQYDWSHPATKIDFLFSHTVEVASKDGVRVVKVPSDLRKIGVRLKHAFEYYRTVFPAASYFDYAKAYESAWRCYRSTVYRKFMEDDSVNSFYKYDNICELDPMKQKMIYRLLGNGCVPIINPNEKPHYVAQTAKMTEMFRKYKKQKKVSNMVLSSAGVLL